MFPACLMTMAVALSLGAQDGDYGERQPVPSSPSPTAEATGIDRTAGNETADHVLRVSGGTSIEFMVLREVDSNRATEGLPVKLRVNKPVMAGDREVIPVGALATGMVTATSKSGAGLKRGELEVSLTGIDWAGYHIALDNIVVHRKGKGGKNDDAIKVILAPFYAPFAPGNSAKLKAGELLEVMPGKDICFSEQSRAPQECEGTIDG